MGMGGGSAPKVPDPGKLAKEQTASNLKTAKGTQSLNQTGQVTPTGSLTYVKDPVTGKMVATTSLSDPQKALLSGQENIGQSANAAGLTQLGATALQGPIDLSNNSVMDAITATYQPAFQRQQDISWEKMNSDLANRGLFPGSEAYDRAVQDFNTAQGNSWNNILQNARAQSVSEMEKSVFDPISAANALRGMGAPAGIGLINTPTATIQPTNTAGIAQQSYEDQLAAQQMGQSQQNAMLGGLFGLGGAAIGGLAGGPIGAAAGAQAANYLFPSTGTQLQSNYG